MKDLEVTPGWVIPSEDLEYRFAKSGGPGGQNVNKLSTKVELRFDLGKTRALSPSQKRRLTARYPAHATGGAAFIVSSDRYRSQARNRTDAAEKLTAMLLSVRAPPRPRISTKPSRAAKRRRLEDKRRRSEIKRGRRSAGDQ